MVINLFVSYLLYDEGFIFFVNHKKKNTADN
jgi:hypothetical protein